jgi:hypothetical protein
VAIIPDLSITALNYGGSPFDGCITFVYAVEVPFVEVLKSCNDQQVYVVPSSSMRVYKSNIQIVIPWDFEDNTYHIHITDGILSYVSDCIKVGIHQCTLLLTWTNADNAFGIDYENLEQINRLRVESKLWNTKGQADRTVFKYSDGSKALIYSDVTLLEELTIKAIPDYLVRALTVGVNHDAFKIDSVEYIAEDDGVEPNWRKSSVTASVNISLSKKASNLINRNCK